MFVDAKVPRSEREAWPLVVRGDEVIAVPGLVEHPAVEVERDRRRLDGAGQEANRAEAPAWPAPECE